jgi:hypothetical protein
MALKAFYDKAEDVPANVKDEYVERNGRFELSVDLGLADAKTFTDFSNLNTALNKERADHKAVRTRLGLLGDRKIEDVLVQLERIPELEIAAEGKIDEKKVDAIVESRIKVRLAPVERERDTLKSQLVEKDQKITSFEQEGKTRKIHDAVRKAAVEAGVIPEAMEDVLMVAERTLVVTDEGKVVSKEGVGVTPHVEASVVLTDLKRTRPYWWGTSSGGGAGGNRGGGGDGNNPWSAEFWNLTEQGKIVTKDPQKAEQLAKAAGTKVGGLPPKKK